MDVRQNKEVTIDISIYKLVSASGNWIHRSAVWTLGAAVSASPLQAQASVSSVSENPIWTTIRSVGALFNITSEGLVSKLNRILVILLIVLVAVLIMSCIRRVSQFVVYSNWGPLRFVCHNHHRSITLHSLAINLAKYVVYFTALGHILNELGVNYTTFLASLSLVGIAIGFGSQGLVQDIVTGFFILFENQFSVGDMVEVGGKVGIVSEIGLRTTRVRDYFGAEITFQNRNIPMAARFRSGGLDAYVDVALPSKEEADRATSVLDTIGVEIHRQFDEVILERPNVEGLVEFESDAMFLRLYVKLWPGQQWLIDQQMVPRIREVFEQEGITIPGDRVIPFYHRSERMQARPVHTS